MAPGLDQRVLNEVIGVGSVAADRPGKSSQGGDEGDHLIPPFDVHVQNYSLPWNCLHCPRGLENAPRGLTFLPGLGCPVEHWGAPDVHEAWRRERRRAWRNVPEIGEASAMSTTEEYHPAAAQSAAVRACLIDRYRAVRAQSLDRAAPLS